MAYSKTIKKTEKAPNRLINEKSPYLLQHAYNPVDWYPWSEEAFEKAHKEDKPIFLSIGYSTCHWCHVMEHESFEDHEVANLMNDVFVSIKVDREERPDLDHVYMAVAQMLTNRGGWPLTIIMTPDKKPFYAATYIPKSSRFGQVGMMELIPRIKTVWKERREEVIESSHKIVDALDKMEKERSGEDINESDFKRAFQDFQSRYDRSRGGFGGAPKFPTPHNLTFLMHYWKRFGDKAALEMVEKTLQAMKDGGIYDHVGFGFHRYSTDRDWLVPHFEKMLYDQALISMAFLDACQITENESYMQTVRQIFTYVIRDLTSAEGGFYSAEDADSEGVEGKFYVWREDEISRILEPESAELIIRLFNIKNEGNYKDEAKGIKTGANIFYVDESISEISADLKISAGEFQQRKESALKKLYNTREKRVRPQRDDKILTDWNGLMIAAMAKGAQVLGEPKYLNAARRAASFILEHLRQPDGRLLHRYRDGDAKFTGHLDDYAFFIWGLIELYEAGFDTHFLKIALELNDYMLQHFWDYDNGGLFFTPDDGESLIVRQKEVYDGALPSGNAVAAMNLLRLSRFTGRTDLEEKASKIDNVFSGLIKQYPSGFTQFLTSMDFALGRSYEVVVVGSSSANDTKKMLDALRRIYNPNRVLIFRPTDKNSSEIEKIARFIKNYSSLDGKATAYVCLYNTCNTPTTDINVVLNQFENGG